METTPGTAVTIAAADCALHQYDITVEGDNDYEERMALHLGGGSLAELPGKSMATASITTEMVGGGVENPPPFAWLLAAGGLNNDDTPGTWVMPADVSAHRTVTVSFWDGLDVKTLRGAVANLKISAEGTGKKIMLQADLVGIFDLPVPGTPPTNISYPVLAPHQLKGVQLLRDGAPFCSINRFELDFASETAIQPCVNDPSGLERGYLTRGKPTLGLDPTDKGRAGDTIWADAFSGATRPLSLTSNLGAGNTITINVPRFQTKTPREGDRENQRTHEIEGTCAALNGGDEVSLVFS